MTGLRKAGRRSQHIFPSWLFTNKRADGNNNNNKISCTHALIALINNIVQDRHHLCLCWTLYDASCSEPTRHIYAMHRIKLQMRSASIVQYGFWKPHSTAYTPNVEWKRKKKRRRENTNKETAGREKGRERERERTVGIVLGYEYVLGRIREYMHVHWLPGRSYAAILIDYKCYKLVVRCDGFIILILVLVSSVSTFMNFNFYILLSCGFFFFLFAGLLCEIIECQFSFNFQKKINPAVETSKLKSI